MVGLGARTRREAVERVVPIAACAREARRASASVSRGAIAARAAYEGAAAGARRGRAEVGGRADLSVRPGAPSVDNPGGDHDKVVGSNPGDVVLDTVVTDRIGDGDGFLGKRRRGEFDDDESHDVELVSLFFKSRIGN